jgi:hypothetical protein
MSAVQRGRDELTSITQGSGRSQRREGEGRAGDPALDAS